MLNMLVEQRKKTKKRYSHLKKHYNINLLLLFDVSMDSVFLDVSDVLLFTGSLIIFVQPATVLGNSYTMYQVVNYITL